VVDFEKLFDTDSEQRNRITLQSLWIAPYFPFLEITPIQDGVPIR
jgi:hypothetical protein